MLSTNSLSEQKHKTPRYMLRIYSWVLSRNRLKPKELSCSLRWHILSWNHPLLKVWLTWGYQRLWSHIGPLWRVTASSVLPMQLGETTPTKTVSFNVSLCWILLLLYLNRCLQRHFSMSLFYTSHHLPRNIIYDMQEKKVCYHSV